MASVDVDELTRRLAEFDAPREVTQWASDAASSFDDAWESCPSALHRMWLAAIAGFPIEAIAEAAAAAFFAIADVKVVPDALLGAVEESVAATTAAACAKRARRCEREAEKRGTYRDAAAGDALARAAAYVCRAFEALRSAEAAMEESRRARARSPAGVIGGGVHAFLPAATGPVSLLATTPASAERSLVHLAIASAAEATVLLAASVAEGARVVDDAVWDALAPDDE